MVQAALLASLSAASVSPSRWALVGIPFTAVGSYYGYAWAVAAAALHVLLIALLYDTSRFPLPAIMAGLLSGCVINFRTTAPVIFGAVVVVVIMLTAIQFEWSLWVVGVPAVAAGALVGGLLYLVSTRSMPRKSKTSHPFPGENLDFAIKMQYTTKSTVRQQDLFV